MIFMKWLMNAIVPYVCGVQVHIYKLPDKLFNISDTIRSLRLLAITFYFHHSVHYLSSGEVWKNRTLQKVNINSINIRKIKYLNHTEQHSAPVPQLSTTSAINKYNRRREQAPPKLLITELVCILRNTKYCSHIYSEKLPKQYKNLTTRVEKDR